MDSVLHWLYPCCKLPGICRTQTDSLLFHGTQKTPAAFHAPPGSRSRLPSCPRGCARGLPRNHASSIIPVWFFYQIIPLNPDSFGIIGSNQHWIHLMTRCFLCSLMILIVFAPDPTNNLAITSNVLLLYWFKRAGSGKVFDSMLEWTHLHLWKILTSS